MPSNGLLGFSPSDPLLDRLDPRRSSMAALRRSVCVEESGLAGGEEGGGEAGGREGESRLLLAPMLLLLRLREGCTDTTV